MYACRHYGPLDVYGGTIEFDATFTEDGELHSQSVRWNRQIQAGDKADAPVRFDRAHGGWITVTWPSDHGWRKPAPGLDPAERAVIRIDNSELLRTPMRKSERWQQSMITRGGETLVHNYEQDRLLVTNPLEPVLASDLKSTMGGGLSVSIASLIAWGSGIDALTIYDVYVTPRKYRFNTYPNDPAGKRRIVSEYRIDTKLLAKTFEAVKDRYGEWRKTLTHPKASCKETQMEDPDAEIIVT